MNSLLRQPERRHQSYNDTTIHWHMASSTDSIHSNGMINHFLGSTRLSTSSPALHDHSHFMDNSINEVVAWQHHQHRQQQGLMPLEVPSISCIREVSRTPPNPTYSIPPDSGRLVLEGNRRPDTNPAPPTSGARNSSKSSYRSERRKAQNRQSQRAFRERREQQLQEVTRRLEDVEKKLAMETSRRTSTEEALSIAEGKLSACEARNTKLQNELVASQMRNEEIMSRWKLLATKIKEHSLQSQQRRDSAANILPTCSDNDTE